MSLLELQPELVQAIILCVVKLRGLKRALRLRLVSKRFASEIDQALFTSRIADDYRTTDFSAPFWPSYLASRAFAERGTKTWHLGVIRQTAVFFCERNGLMDEDSLKRFVKKLSCLAIANDAFVTGWLRGECPPPEQQSQQSQLLTAASYLNDAPLVASLMADGYSPLNGSAVFGFPVSAAASQGHIAIVELLMLYGQLPIDSTKQRLHAIRGAIAGGYPDILELILESRFGNNPITRTGPLAHKFFVRRLKAGLYTTCSPEIFDRLYEMFRWQIPDVEADILGECLYQAALNGREKMVCHLLRLGAPVNGSPQSPREIPLVAALKKGRHETAELLVSAGADVNLSHNLDKTPLMAAASGGFLETVKILLDRGAQVNVGSPPPIVFAIRLEHTIMFSLLRQRGALLNTIESGGAALQLAHREGLQSMVELLVQEREDLAVAVTDIESRHGHDHLNWLLGQNDNMNCTC
ncbi:ankyrin repeat-containing domain protein [Halenospora varia]|nr:ankyrin repeat-containing domain protein [Halenospora varia]